MKTLIYCLFVSCVLSIFYLVKNSDKPNTINAIIGDRSYIVKFDHEPSSSTGEDLRIKTHLEFVENILREKNTVELDPYLCEKRKHLLDLLHHYRVAGIFPRNYDHLDKRTPCFIDKNGNLCAVAYLVEQTAGRKAAEKINRIHKYDKILEMEDPELDQWIRSSGFTKEECAMIQPTYGPSIEQRRHLDPMKTALGIGFTGLNLCVTTVNLINSKANAKSDAANIGMIFGTLQAGFGTLELLKYGAPAYLGGTDGNLAMQNSGVANVILGLSTGIIGFRTALSLHHKKVNPVTWRMFSFPAPEQRVGLGLYWARKI